MWAHVEHFMEHFMVDDNEVNTHHTLHICETDKWQWSEHTSNTSETIFEFGKNHQTQKNEQKRIKSSTKTQIRQKTFLNSKALQLTA